MITQISIDHYKFVYLHVDIEFHVLCMLLIKKAMRPDLWIIKDERDPNVITKTSIDHHRSYSSMWIYNLIHYGSH